MLGMSDPMALSPSNSGAMFDESVTSQPPQNSPKLLLKPQRSTLRTYCTYVLYVQFPHGIVDAQSTPTPMMETNL